MIVVGAGSAGATLAVRLARLGCGRVVLVDAGPDLRTGIARDWLIDADRLPPAGEPLLDRAKLEMAAAGRGSGRGCDRRAELLGGRLVGGSSAVNGAYFVRATDPDLARWAEAAPAWTQSRWLDAYRAVESDREMGGQRHGTSGPIPVSRRSWPIHPVTEALFAAADQSGVAPHEDLNDGAELGWGMVPRNVDGRRRVGSAALLVEPIPTGLSVHGGVTAERVVFDGSHVVGVEALVDGRVERISAGTVVLSAGTIGSAGLLWRSGIGPADALEPRAIAVVRDVPGLARRVTNHSVVELMWRPLGDLDVGPLLQGAVYFAVEDGDPVEVLATCRSYGVANGGDPDDVTLSLRVSPMRPRGVGRIEWNGSQPTVHADYLGDTHDRAVIRSAVRQVTAWAHGEAFAALIGEWLGPDPETVSSDAALDGWIAENLGTSMHLCSSVPAGPPDDPTAVVDELGRVRGVEGLRVIDCSILPDVPSRGPAFTAMALAELLAPTFGQDHSGTAAES